MAYHDSVVTSFSAATTNIVGNMCATNVGDALYCFISQDSGTPQSASPPTGWAQVSGSPITVSTPDSQTWSLFEFTGGAPASPPATYTFTGNQSATCQIMFVSFSGRSLVRSFLTPTTNSSSNTTPVSIALTGGTVTANDDIAVFSGLDKTGGTWTYAVATGTPGTFTSRQSVDDGTGFYGMGLSTLNSAPAGASGTITVSATETGAHTAGWGGWVLSLQAGGPTINTQPVQTTVYAGNTATFTVSATTSGGALSYQWKKNGSNVGTNSSSYTTPNTVNSDNLSTIQVAVTDSNGTVNSSTVYLLVIPTAALMWVKH